MVREVIRDSIFSEAILHDNKEGSQKTGLIPARITPQYRGNVSIGRNNHLITGLHFSQLAISHKDKSQCIQSVPHTYTTGCTTIISKSFFKRWFSSPCKYQPERSTRIITSEISGSKESLIRCKSKYLIIIHRV